MEIFIRHPKIADSAEWSRMRTALWPDTSEAVHAEEIASFLSGNLAGWLSGLKAVAIFVAVRPNGNLCGFVEASIRHMVDGCTTLPVGYVEGWYVDPDIRRHGVGRKLVDAAQNWALSQGCREIASDTHLDNAASICAHKALGFIAEPPTVRFCKWLPGRAGENPGSE